MKKFLLRLLVVCLFTSKAVFSMDSLEQKQKQAEYGQLYLKYSKPQQEAAKKYLKKMNIGKESRILDIGCGPGDITVHIFDSCSEEITVFGIDKSSSMIEKARKLYEGRSGKLYFGVLDAEKEHYKHLFSHVVSFLTLHSIANKAAFIKNAFTSLNPGGELLLTAKTFDEKRSGLEWTSLAKGALLSATAKDYVSEDEMKKLLQDAGFTDIKVKTKIESYQFESVEDLANFFYIFLFDFEVVEKIFTERASKELAMKCAREWIAASESGQISYSWANLVVTANKPSE